MKECLICDKKVHAICPYCSNEYCEIHFRWHIHTKKECRKEYEKEHGKIKDKDINDD